jgi:hypothetical protein
MVGQVRFDFLTVKETLCFRLKAEIPVLQTFAKDMTAILRFGWQGIDENTGQPLLRCTPDLLFGLESLISEWKGHSPAIQGLQAFFRSSVKPNEPFYFMAERFDDRELRRNLGFHLKALELGREFSEVKEEWMQRFGDLLVHYEMAMHGHSIEKIGEPKKTKRVCRFCSRTMPKVSFESKAHALSEALGNKKVVLFDECDECNERFGEGIETSLINYLAPFRTFHGLKGNGGVKSMKGRNYTVVPNDKGAEVELRHPAPVPERGAGSLKFTIATSDKFNAQDLYRCLCKYFISVLDPSELETFGKCIAWVNGGQPPSVLPRVGQLVSYDRFCEHAVLTTYLRRSSDTSLPAAIGELRYACKVFLFVVPFVDDPPIASESPDGPGSYWSLFKHLHRWPEWSFNDMSDTKTRTLIWNFIARVKPNEGPTGPTFVDNN